MITVETFARILEVRPTLLILSASCGGVLEGMVLPALHKIPDGRMMYKLDEALIFTEDWYSRQSVSTKKIPFEQIIGHVSLSEFAVMAGVPPLELYLAVISKGKLDGVRVPAPEQPDSLVFGRLNVIRFLFQRYTGRHE